MKRVLFATGNETKAKRFSKGLQQKGIEVISLKDIDQKIEVNENGKNGIENALIKDLIKEDYSIEHLLDRLENGNVGSYKVLDDLNRKLIKKDDIIQLKESEEYKKKNFVLYRFQDEYFLKRIVKIVVKKEKIEGLIIDLRDNGGGYLTSAAKVTWAIFTTPTLPESANHSPPVTSFLPVW